MPFRWNRFDPDALPEIVVPPRPPRKRQRWRAVVAVVAAAAVPVARQAAQVAAAGGCSCHARSHPGFGLIKRRMIRLERVSKRYDNGNQALSELSLDIAARLHGFPHRAFRRRQKHPVAPADDARAPTRGQVLVNGRDLRQPARAHGAAGTPGHRHDLPGP